MGWFAAIWVFIVTGHIPGPALLAGLAGAAASLGVWLTVAGLGHHLMPPDTSPRRRPRRRSSAGAFRARHAVSIRWRAAAGLVAGAALWAVSGWVVAVLVLPAATVGLPLLLARPDTDLSVRRLEALEEWTRHLSGVLDVGVGLEQAIMVNLRSTPAAIRPQVQTLVSRLTARWSTEAALRAFADDLDDATGDLVAASLVLGARRRGAGLTRVLQGLAETVADEVKMRRAVEADRAKPRTTARAVTFITLAVLGLLALNTTYIAPYGTPVGQVALVLLLGAYAGALVWMQVMTRERPTPRFLPNPDDANSDRSPSSAKDVSRATPVEVG